MLVVKVVHITKYIKLKVTSIKEEENELFLLYSSRLIELLNKKKNQHTQLL